MICMKAYLRVVVEKHTHEKHGEIKNEMLSWETPYAVILSFNFPGTKARHVTKSSP